MTVAETPTSAGADRVLTKGILGEKDERAVGATSVAESHPGIFSDIESAVIAARQSQEAFETVPMEKRQEIIEAIRNVGKENADALSKMAVAETGCGLDMMSFREV